MATSEGSMYHEQQGQMYAAVKRCSRVQIGLCFGVFAGTSGGMKE